MLAYLFIALAVLWRVILPLEANFTPLLASLLFFGSRMERKWFWVPVALFIGCDLYLNYKAGYPTTPDFAVTWLWYAAMVWAGGLLRNTPSVLRVAGISLACSLSFFFISNLMVWVIYPEMYPRTLAGLGACYVAAIPFFRSNIIGNVAYSVVFFSVPVLFKIAPREGLAGNTARFS